MCNKSKEVTDIHRVYSDYSMLVKNQYQMFDGQLLLKDKGLYADIDDNVVCDFTLVPSEGIYKDCEIQFSACLDGYPKNLPNVKILSSILHPNIKAGHHRTGHGDVYLDIFDEWETYEDKYKSLELIVQGLLFLFHQPNLHDRILPYAAFNSHQELADAVNLTKYGSKARVDDDAREAPWKLVEFSDVYSFLN